MTSKDITGSSTSSDSVCITIDHPDPMEASSNALDPMEGSSNSPDPMEGSSNSTDPMESSSNALDPMEGSSNSPDPMEGSSNSTDPMEGSSNASDLVEVQPRLDFRTIFDKMSSNAKNSKKGADTSEPESVFKLKKLARFLKKAQRMDCTVEHVHDLIKKYETNPKFSSRGYITSDGLVSYFLADENDAFITRELQVTDMDHPLSHYFIASSFNTHFHHGQAFEDSYSTALESGCRHLEMDCWDSDDLYPWVMCGLNSSRKGSFLKVLHAINNSAFTASPYPVILTVRVFCSEPRQDKMIEAFKEVFADKLVEGFMFNDPKYQWQWPSPNELQRKILIINKNTQFALDVDGCRQRNRCINCYESSENVTILFPGSSDDRDDNDIAGNDDDNNDEVFCDIEEEAVVFAVDDPVDSDQKYVSCYESSENVTILLPGSSDDRDDNDIAGNDDDNNDEVFGDIEEQAVIFAVDDPADSDQKCVSCYESSENVATILSDSSDDRGDNDVAGNDDDNNDEVFGDIEEEAVISAVDDINESLDKIKSEQFRRSQITEDKVMDMLAKTETQMVYVWPSKHNVGELFNPILFWTAGCQMVGIDYQLRESSLWKMNDAFFSQNGGCGYLLKPDWMRDPLDAAYRRFNPYAEMLDSVPTVQLRLSVVLWRDRADGSVSNVYVKVVVFGLPGDYVVKKTETMTRGPGCYAPGWLSSKLFCFRIHLPELTFIRFAVCDATTDLELCQRVMPVVNLRAGYRHVNMRDAQNARLPSANLIVFSRMTKLSPVDQVPCVFNGDYNVSVYRDSAEEPCDQVTVNSDTTAAQVIATVLEKIDERPGDGTWYLMLEEKRGGTKTATGAKRTALKKDDPPVIQRVLHGNDRPLELLASRGIPKVFVLEKVHEGSVSASVSSADQEVRPKTHLVLGLYDVGPRMLSTRVVLARKTTARDVCGQVLAKVKTAVDPDDFTLMESLKVNDSKFRIRKLDDDEVVITTVTKWANPGVLVVMKRNTANNWKTQWLFWNSHKNKKRNGSSMGRIDCKAPRASRQPLNRIWRCLARCITILLIIATAYSVLFDL